MIKMVYHVDLISDQYWLAFWLKDDTPEYILYIKRELNWTDGNLTPCNLCLLGIFDPYCFYPY